MKCSFYIVGYHISTRWLSLEKTVSRTLEMYQLSWKVILVQLRKEANVYITNKTVWKFHDKSTWKGISYIIKCFISNTNLVILVLANSSKSPYCLTDPWSHSETPNTLALLNKFHKYYIISENPCDSNPCTNGGVCVHDGKGNAECDCIDYWSGPRCEDLSRYRSILCCMEMA